MRTFPLVLLAVVAVGCAQQDNEADVAADTTLAAPAPAGITLADASGTWRVQAKPANSDSVVTSYTMWATGDPAGWKMQFDGRTDTIAISDVRVDGDSIMTRFGPYSSALRPNVQVVTETVGRLRDGKM